MRSRRSLIYWRRSEDIPRSNNCQSPELDSCSEDQQCVDSSNSPLNFTSKKSQKKSGNHAEYYLVKCKPSEIRNDVIDVQVRNDVINVQIRNDVNNIQIRNDVIDVQVRNDVIDVQIRNDVGGSLLKKSRAEYGREFLHKPNRRKCKHDDTDSRVKNKIVRRIVR